MIGGSTKIDLNDASGTFTEDLDIANVDSAPVSVNAVSVVLFENTAGNGDCTLTLQTGGGLSSGKKTYFFINATGGTLTVSAGAGDNVDILTGYTKHIHVNIDGGTTRDVVATLDDLSVDTLRADTRIDAKNIKIYQGGSTDFVEQDVAASGGIKIKTFTATHPVTLESREIVVGSGATTTNVTTSGIGALTIDTNSGTTSGSVVIRQGTDANMDLKPDGTGKIIVGSGSDTATIGSSGTENLVLGTNSGSGQTITITHGGAIVLPSVDIGGGAIDGTTIGATTKATASVNQLTVDTGSAAESYYGDVSWLPKVSPSWTDNPGIRVNPSDGHMQFRNTTVSGTSDFTGWTDVGTGGQSCSIQRGGITGMSVQLTANALKVPTLITEAKVVVSAGVCRDEEDTTEITTDSFLWTKEPFVGGQTSSGAGVNWASGTGGGWPQNVSASPSAGWHRFFVIQNKTGTAVVDYGWDVWDSADAAGLRENPAAQSALGVGSASAIAYRQIAWHYFVLGGSGFPNYIMPYTQSSSDLSRVDWLYPGHQALTESPVYGDPNSSHDATTNPVWNPLDPTGMASPDGLDSISGGAGLQSIDDGDFAPPSTTARFMAQWARSDEVSTPTINPSGQVFAKFYTPDAAVDPTGVIPYAGNYIDAGPNQYSIAYSSIVQQAPINYLSSPFIAPEGSMGAGGATLAVYSGTNSWNSGSGSFGVASKRGTPNVLSSLSATHCEVDVNDDEFPTFLISVRIGKSVMSTFAGLNQLAIRYSPIGYTYDRGRG
jgi:hypothetical protein